MKQVDVSGAVILNDKNEILCALRSQSMSLAGLWEFPGGKLEPGESPEDSLKREIQEELNCEVNVHKMVVDHVHEYPNVIVRLRTYYAQLVSGTPKALEHEELRWMPATELLTLNWAPADIPTVHQVIADLT